MDWLHAHLWLNGHFNGWGIVGWTGNAIFSTRFLIQWYATEKKKSVVVPIAFWWLSLGGSLLLLSYALFSQKSLVFIFAYAFAWIPYVRNIIIHHRHLDAQLKCAACGAVCPPKSNYCLACGARLAAEPGEIGGSRPRD
jgi:lipid-A-disaccharide synthase-like uncharacterized protein